LYDPTGFDALQPFTFPCTVGNGEYAETTTCEVYSQYSGAYMPIDPLPGKEQWDSLSPECQRGLTNAMHGNVTGRVDALNRAFDAMGVIEQAADAHGIDPALLAAIGLRETGFREIAQIGGGDGRGVFQIDIGKNPSVTASEAYDINFAAGWAANFLSKNMTTLQQEFPNFTPDQLLQATAASYNFGTTNISGNPNTIDVGSAHNNYGSNVLDLMNCFK
jgi:soluble lytic murein transglycosylase-like protein